MIVKCVQKSTPRSDGVQSPPTGIQVGREYVVAEILYDEGKYSIINDENKMARYSMNRFTVIDETPVRPLREAYNVLTTPLRSRIKELEKQIKEMQQ